MATRSRVDPLPSSKAEIGRPLEGRSATLERGGDWPAGLRGTLEWAACWASLSPSLFSEGEVGRGPSWAQLSYWEFVFFKSGLSTTIRVSLIVAPDRFGDCIDTLSSYFVTPFECVLAQIVYTVMISAREAD